MLRAGSVVLAVLAVCAQKALAGDKVVADRWYAHFHKDVKAGWDHTRVLRSTVDGKKVWITETESRLIRSMDRSLLQPPVTSSSRIVEDEAGAVLSYATSVCFGLASGPQMREGTVKDGTISAVEDGRTRTLPYPAGALGPRAIERAVVAALGPSAEGKYVAFRTIDATADAVSWRASPSTELVNVLGRFVWMYRVTKWGVISIEDEMFIGPSGIEFAGATDLGMHQWFLTEESVAKADAQPASLLTSRIVAPDRAIDEAKARSRAVFRLAKKDGKVGALPEECGQRITARKDGAIEIEVKFDEVVSGRAHARPYAGKEDVKRWLAETPLVELSNARLREYAGNAIGELINSLRSARMIELFVKKCVRPARADVGFGTACDAISSATGDSTEAAVLAVALARASGIPARLVAGFVYWAPDTWPGGKFPRGAFALHTWAELYVAEGVWFPIDPMRMDGTQPQQGVDELEGHGGFDATHVAVVKSDLATERPITDIVMPVLEFMDGLSIEVVEPK
jgi:transglutaminase-like putative cysteine protease